MMKNYREFGGWLMVFKIASLLSIVFNIALLCQVFSLIISNEFYLNNIDTFYYGLIIFESFTAIAILFSVALIVNRPIKKIPKLIKILIITMGCLSIAASIGRLTMLFLYLSNDNINTSLEIANIFLRFCYMVIWTLYFSFSKRVKYYYGFFELQGFKPITNAELYNYEHSNTDTAAFNVPSFKNDAETKKKNELQ